MVGEAPRAAGTVSLRGRFEDSRTIVVHEVHRHSGRLRDIASFAGLAFVFAIFALGLWLMDTYSQIEMPQRFSARRRSVRTDRSGR